MEGIVHKPQFSAILRQHLIFLLCYSLSWFWCAHTSTNILTLNQQIIILLTRHKRPFLLSYTFITKLYLYLVWYCVFFANMKPQCGCNNMRAWMHTPMITLKTFLSTYCSTQNVWFTVYFGGFQNYNKNFLIYDQKLFIFTIKFTNS